MTEVKLATLFSDGLSKIETRKCDNLFKDLDSRNLTDAEENIIAQRVALQQRMLEEYEKREKSRKIREILDICPDLTEEEAECALKLHGHKEEDAAAALVSGIAFRRKVQAMCGNTRPQPTRLPAPQCQNRSVTSVGPICARPAGEFLKHLRDGVFVGTFKGKGWELYKSRPLPRPNTSAAAPPSSVAHQVQGKKRGRPSKQSTLELTPPKPRTATRYTRRALGAATAELPLSLPVAPHRRRSGRLRSGAVSRSPSAAVTMVPEVHDVREPEQEAQEGREMEPSTLASPQCRTIRETRQLDFAAAGQDNVADQFVEETAMDEDFELLPPSCSFGPLEESGGVQANKAEQAPLRLNQCRHDSHQGSESPGTVSPEVPAAAPQATAVPRRQRGGRRSRRNTPSLPWTAPDEPLHGEDGVSHGQQPQLEQPAGPVKPLKTFRSRGEYDEGAAAEDHTPAEGALQMDSGNGEEPALQDHQVAQVSSGGASQSMEGSGTRLRSGKGTDDNEAEAHEENAERPKRQRRASAKATEALLNITLAADMQAWGYLHHSPRATNAKPAQGVKRANTSEPGQAQSPRRSPRVRKGASPGAAAAAAAAAVLVNKPRLGRVKRCSSKQVELLCIGELRLDPGWYNNGYIFPEGFCTRTVFRSSVELDQLCLHTCSILGKEDHFWPAPTFRIVAADRPDEELDAKSPTGAWNAVLSRINSEIETRRRAGEDLPPPPKTAIAGPEYFGLTHPEVLAQIEALDHEGLCTAYWAGKEDRLAYGQVHGIAPDRKGPTGSTSAAQPRLFPAPTGGASRRRRRGGRGTDAAGNELDGLEEDHEEAYAGNRWSGVDRAERARRRAGEDSASGGADEDSPLPHVIDPITLEPVVTPAMSPAGHVMGLATWTAVLAEQGKCPFTQQPLRRDQITVLTKSNIDRFRDRLRLP
ncbi:probable transforming growth factor beta regulator 1 at C-terminar half [Coccomyxa sp. Obi]|nr:probable transforming growth factor beta regulator 1 at C-terminar half [Coccomyxa sp. Obi]